MTKEGLDRLDMKILAELQKDARISVSDLSAKVGLSLSPCSVRLRKLEKQGHIKQYVTIIDEDLVGGAIVAFIDITLTDHKERTNKSFENRMRSMPEVLECHSVGGDTDYIIKAAVADMQEFQTFIDQVLEADDSIKRFSSKISYAEIVQKFQLPVSQQK